MIFECEAVYTSPVEVVLVQVFELVLAQVLVFGFALEQELELLWERVLQ